MKVFLSIGSNIRPAKNIPACLKKLKAAFKVKKISPVYETSPLTLPSPPLGERIKVRGNKNFWNLAVQIETSLSRTQLRRNLREVEAKLGRKRNTNRFAPRPIDIDLVGFGNWWRRGAERFAFVLFPLAKIAPRFKPRGVKASLKVLTRDFCDPAQKIRRLGRVL